MHNFVIDMHCHMSYVIKLSLTKFAIMFFFYCCCATINMVNKDLQKFGLKAPLWVKAWRQGLHQCKIMLDEGRLYIQIRKLVSGPLSHRWRALSGSSNTAVVGLWFHGKPAGRSASRQMWLHRRPALGNYPSAPPTWLRLLTGSEAHPALRFVR